MEATHGSNSWKQLMEATHGSNSWKQLMEATHGMLAINLMRPSGT